MTGIQSGNGGVRWLVDLKVYCRETGSFLVIAKSTPAEMYICEMYSGIGWIGYSISEVAANHILLSGTL